MTLPTTIVPAQCTILLTISTTTAILSMDSLVSMNAKQMKVGEGEKDKEING